MKEKVTPSSSNNCFIVEEQISPSSDFFILPMFQSQGFNIHRMGFNELPSEKELTSSTVVFVRYLPKHWRKLIDKTNIKIDQLIYFMDDDLFDWQAAAGTPWLYRYKLLTLATLHQNWLKKKPSEPMGIDSLFTTKIQPP